MRLVAFTFSIGLPGVLGVPESWESQSLGSLGSLGVLGVSGVPESQTVNCNFAKSLFAVALGSLSGFGEETKLRFRHVGRAHNTKYKYQRKEIEY